MKNKLFFLIMMAWASFSFGQTPIITAIADGDCPGGTPKLLEIYADGTVDFSLYTLQNQTNANTTWGNDLDLTPFGTVTDAFVYVYYDGSYDNYLTEFPSATTVIESGVMNLNGDDAVRIILTSTSTVIDGFGVDGTDGTGETWEWKDGYAKRNNSTGADAGFTEANWSINNGALNGEGTCQSGTTFEDVMGGIGTFTTGGGSTNDQTSTVTAPTTQLPAGTISSIATDSIPVLQFVITDASGDGLPTNVTGIKFFTGPNNTLTIDENLSGGAVYDKTNSVIVPIIGAPVVNANDVYLPISLTVAEGTSVTLEVALYIDPTNAPDGGILQFQINADSHGFTADGTGSDFEPTFAGGGIVGNNFTVDVVATQLTFTQEPSDTEINTTMVPPVQVAATDVGGNIDVDYAATDITLGFAGTGTMTGTNPVSTASGVATFSDLSFDAENTSITLTADGGTFAQITSSSFNINGPQTSTLPYIENFDADLGQTYSYSVSGNTKEWFFDTDKATMNGYNSGDTEEDWLILPGINLDNYSNEIMTFTSERQYGSDDANNYIKLLYSVDYTGLGDPSGAAWTELTYTQPSASNTMTPSGDIDLSAITGANVYIAFKYHYESGSYRRWSIDNINIAEPVVTGGGADCSNALTITAGTHHAIHTQVGNGSNYDQWYSFVATVSGTATVENCASDVDIYILIQNGTCGNDYDMADDDNCGDGGLAENFSFQITAGETYFIGLGNWDQASTPEYDWTLSESDVTPVNSIALLRAGTVGNKYELTSEAILTFQQAFRGQKFIEDATAAILIDDNSGIITTTYNLGDGITGITGVLGEYNGMLQFVPTVDPGVASTTGNTVTPQVITLAQFTSNFEDYEAELVTLNDVTFADAGGTFATGTVYAMTDASKGTASFRTNFYSADYIGGTIPTNVNVTGICYDKGTSGDGYTFSARDLADFDVILTPSLTITSPVNASTITTADVDIVFTVGDFVVGDNSGGTDDGHIHYTVDGGSTVMYYSTDPISLTGLTDGSHIVNMELVDNSHISLTPPVTASVNFTVDTSIGVNDVNANAITIYPNPSSGTFTINVNEDCHIEVVDIAGKIIETKNINSDAILNISKTGVYFIKFFTKNGTTVRKIVVQ